MELIREHCGETVLYTVMSRAETVGYAAVDTTINGRSSGGLRMLPDVTAEEIVGLARAMTLKYGFLGLPQGGAKAGVRWDPETPAEQRRARLAEFAIGLAALLRHRTYVPYPDMGTCATDIAAMLKSLGIHVLKHDIRDHDSGYYTAISVAAAALAGIRYLGLKPEKCQAAVEGFGKVGKALAVLLQEAGLTVVAVSTRLGALYNPHGLNLARLIELSARMGSSLVEGYREADRIPGSELVQLPVELLAPCARHHSIRAANASRLCCRIVSAGANNPATPEAEQILARRGILCLPDFVSNSGGVLGGTMEFAGVRHATIVRMIGHAMESSITSLLEQTGGDWTALRRIAESTARERHRLIKQRSERPSVANAVFTTGLNAYRRGLIPAALVGRLAPVYFRRLPPFRRSAVQCR